MQSNEREDGEYIKGENDFLSYNEKIKIFPTQYLD